jgi:hypothetical protein
MGKQSDYSLVEAVVCLVQWTESQAHFCNKRIGQYNDPIPFSDEDLVNVHSICTIGHSIHRD